MLITSQMIWEELKEQKKLLRKILDRDLEHSIEEISLHKAARLLRTSDATLFELAEKKEIPARKYSSKKTPRGYSYKFKVFDIHEFQRREQYHASMEIESIEELKKRVFG